MINSLTAFKWVTLVLALILLVSLVSCGGQGAVTPTPTATLTPAVTPTPTPATNSPPSTISSLSGEVLLQEQGSTTWVQAVAGMKLEAGDYLKTGGNGTAVLLFFEGSTMEVQADTEILINELSLATGTGSTTIGLKQLLGSTVNRVQKLVDSESKYEVDTPAASAAVRGTIFKLLVEIDGNTTLNSDEGDVWFTASGVTVLVSTGMQSFACVGCPPSKPSPSVTPTPIPTPTSTPLPTPTPTPIVTPTPNVPPQYYYAPAPTPTPTPEGGALQVQITSPQDGYTTDNRLLTVSGNVTSTNEINTETGATITLNGEARSLPLTTEGNSTYNYYSFGTQVELIPGSNTITVTATDINGQTGNDTVVVNANIQSYAIEAELTWDTNDTDLDSHLIAPGGKMATRYTWSASDCYYDNPNPDWDGSGGSSPGDPSLDQDVITGYGPEYIVLVAPPFDGIYQYKVFYYDDNGHGPSTAMVKIRINDVLVWQGNRTMSYDEVWDCANIDWPSGNITTGPTLTVASQGCCPILVEGLSVGNRTVSAGGNSTFSGISANTQVTLTAQTGESCSLDYWQVDGGNSTGENPITVTMASDHEAIAACSSTPIPTPTPTPTPTPSVYTLTVVSQGCCPILVEGLPAGNQTVPAGGNSTFSGISANTQVTLTAQTGENCSLDHWQVDGGNSTGENPLTLTMNSDYEATAACVHLHTLTVYSDGCCPIQVTWFGGNYTIPAGGNQTFVVPQGTVVTADALDGGGCATTGWYLDLEPTSRPDPLTITMDADHQAWAYCGQA